MNLVIVFSLLFLLFSGGRAGIVSFDRDNSPPAILLVPGAFHQAVVYDTVGHLLKNAGYNGVVEAINLPSVGSLASRDDDVKALRRVMDKYLDLGRDIVLVGNSYGCTVIGDAVLNIPSATTTPPYDEEGRRRGRVVSLLYFSGYLPYTEQVVHPETKPDIRLVSPKWFAFLPNDSPSAIPKTVRWDGDLQSSPPDKEFYNVLAQRNPAAANYWVGQLRYSSFAALNATARYIPYNGDFRVIYVAGKQDNSVPPELWHSYLDQPGAKFILEVLDGDHVPMLSRPEEVVKLIINYTKL
ncbi:alpha/beta-hydrolase [Periconia macrospinosa]|uniref:Alpha/beta-hydrolase n=1 Tax=Periconia macrospinosa TaxID=97972 RepID=A0A2V1DEU9_9PLEO|nr:alpha/beta-hydrolase [Periconia macrospinosa]